MWKREFDWFEYTGTYNGIYKLGFSWRQVRARW
jgi:hypothetical protein